MKKYLITGVAGFIGANVALRLLEDNKDIQVIGIDNMNNYYDVKLKEYRLSKLFNYNNFKFIKDDIANKENVEKLFEKFKPNIVLNFAAQAGVRYSITNPDAYIQSNIIGFYNIIESCKKNSVEHLIYASSSSVYGNNSKIPYSTDDKVDSPVSLYAATKKSNELIAYSYSKLYNIPTTGLRFFTVYGPAGRPDMAYFKFTNQLISGDSIKIFNYGNCKRDFTYIDDIVEGVIRVVKKAPKNEIMKVPYRIYNIGKGSPEKLLDFVKILQEELVKVEILDKNYDFDSHKELVGMQQGDVEITYADTKPLQEEFDFKPNIQLREGLKRFSEWYKDFYME